MLDEFQKSIKATLYERAVSPLFGALLFSWLIWNWEILYLTFFISESSIQGTKIDYIKNNLTDTFRLFIYPLISSLFILTVYPLIANGAYWLSLRFQRWRMERKTDSEKKQRLTIEDSLQLREELAKAEEKIDRLIKKKDIELEAHGFQISELNDSLKQKETTINNIDKENLELKTTMLEKEKTILSLKTNVTVLANDRGSHETVIFFENFEKDKGWDKPYGIKDNNPIRPQACRIENSIMIFQAKYGEVGNSNDGKFGAYYDLKKDIISGETYEISCKVIAVPNTTMKFQLWVHDTVDGSLGIYNPIEQIIPPTNEGMIVAVNFKANNKQAIRIHLHCRGGEGLLCVNYVKVRRISTPTVTPVMID